MNDSTKRAKLSDHACSRKRSTSLLRMTVSSAPLIPSVTSMTTSLLPKVDLLCCTRIDIRQCLCIANERAIEQSLARVRGIKHGEWRNGNEAEIISKAARSIVGGEDIAQARIHNLL